LRKDIDGIICYTWGYNANKLLPYLDFWLIKENWKPFIWYSDITVLLNAIRAKTGCVTFHWPVFEELCYWEEQVSRYTMEYLQKIFVESSYKVSPSRTYQDQRSDHTTQTNSKVRTNKGWNIISWGKTRWTIIGGNISTLGLLQWTEFFPDLGQDMILFLEDDDLWLKYALREFERNFESLTQLPMFKQVKWIVLGRFQRSYVPQCTMANIKKILDKKPWLKELVILWNVDFGHTQPNFTFPIWWMCEIDTSSKSIEFSIL